MVSHNADHSAVGHKSQFKVVKVHIFWEGHTILRNLGQLFDWQYIGQKIGGDFAKLCGLLKIYELYYKRSLSLVYGLIKEISDSAMDGSSEFWKRLHPN